MSAATRQEPHTKTEESGRPPLSDFLLGVMLELL